MIRIKTIYVRDLTGNDYACQASITQDYELNGNQSLTAVLLPSKVNRAFIDVIAEMWQITDFDDVEHHIVYVKKRGKGDSLTVEIKAVPTFFDDFDTDRIYEEYNEHITAQRCFSLIFDGSPYNVVLNGSFDAVEWQGLGGGETRLEMFKRALERYQAEFRIVGNTVYIENLIGRDTQFQYRYRLNASNITKEHDAKEMWTYAKGYANYEDDEEGGWENAKLKREYTSPLAQVIGVRHAPPVKDGRIKHASVLDSQLKTLVDDSLKISVSADILDLRRQGYPLAQPEMGDRVFVIDERIGLDEEVRVVDMSITRNWRGEVIDCNLTFGSEGVTKRYQSNLSTAVKDISEVMAGRKKLPYSVLDNAVLEATKLIQNAHTELQFPSTGGIVAVDPTNPNYLVAFTSRGIGVSSDGGATFPEAITGLGINASVITAGVLNGIRIVQDSGNRKLIMDEGEIESHYNNKLAMKFGQYSLDFYNRSETLLGQIVPLVNENNSTYEGLGFIVENDFLNIGMRQGGYIRPVLRSSFYDKVTTVSGPYNNLNDGASLRLFGNRRAVSEDRYSATDQPAIILNQGDDSNNVEVYFGGFGRRSGATFQVRYRDSDNSSVNRIEANSGGVYLGGRVVGVSSVTGAIIGPNGSAYYENSTGTNNLYEAKALRANGLRAWGTGLVNLYLGTQEGGEVRVTNGNGRNDGENIVYRDIRAAAFNQSSSLEYKTNIENLEDVGLKTINDLTVLKYDLKNDIDRGIFDRKIGFIAEFSDSVSTKDRSAIDLYKLSSYLTKAVQELSEKVEVLESAEN